MPSNDAREQIRESVNDFINTVAEYMDERDIQTPQTTVFTPTNSRREDPEKIITRPSKVIEIHHPVKKSFFNETAHWLVESGNGFDFPPACDPSDKAAIATYYRKRLFEFAQLVVDYTGKYEFSEEAFTTAYGDHIKPKYQSKHTYEIIVPLTKFSLVDSENRREELLSLPTQIDPRQIRGMNCEIKADIELSRLNDWEFTGIQTYGTYHISSDAKKMKQKLDWQYKLKVVVEVEYLPTTYDEDRPGIDQSWTSSLAKKVGIRVATQVVTALRLFKPRSYVGIGPAYVTDQSWLTYRDYCIDISGYFNSAMSRATPVITLEYYQLQKSEYDDFRDFWHTIRETCDLEQRSDLSSAVRRFNQMFQDKTYEDKVIDGCLGFETTLAYEGVTNFRFPARAVLLFRDRTLHLRNSEEMTSQFVYEFANELQSKRTAIIHNDAGLGMGKYKAYDELPNHPSIDDLSSREFVLETRYFLSQAIQVYSELLTEDDISIQALNQEKIDPRIIDALQRQ